MNKKAFVISALILSLVFVAAVASAKTVVTGRVYDSPDLETASGVGGANVNVTCAQVYDETTTISDGTYVVTFLEGCNIGDSVTVGAYKEGIGAGTQTEEIQDYTQALDVGLGVVNVVLVPEFTLIVGLTTIIGAIAVFFIIRRK